MPERPSKFHDFALKTGLFKGRPDWYFCFLKAEKIAHVLSVLAESAPPHKHLQAEELADRAALLPGDIAHLAAGETDISPVLADVFALLSAVRTMGTRKAYAEETSALLAGEYERLAERLLIGANPSPFVSASDFSLPALPGGTEFLSLGKASVSGNPSLHEKAIKDNKGHKGQTDRMSLILQYVREHKNVSIKEIAKAIRDCSEKTIQRELGLLIQQGLIRKVGERRWSTYVPA